MTKSAIFTKAHQLTKKSRKAGDNYRRLFSMFLRLVYSQLRTMNVLNIGDFVFNIELKKTRKSKKESQGKQILFKFA